MAKGQNRSLETKSLENMSLEELWRLFPIELVPHRDVWAHWYSQVREQLTAMSPEDAVVAVSHIGSTAIANLQAKNIVDILVEFTADTWLDDMAAILRDRGFLLMARTGTRVDMNMGYTPHGWVEPVYHVHLRYKDDNDELFFRDYLNAHPDIAREYERLKLELAPKFKYDRDGYTAAKGEFVRRYSAFGRNACRLGVGLG